MATGIRPIFRWAGSKRALLPELISRTPRDFCRYVEPFAGSACLFFALKPKSAKLGDLNPDLIDAYRIMRWRPRKVASALRDLPEDEETYYRLRAKPARDLPAVARAARFVYLNRYAFNGVYRVNRAGQFNVPRGSRTGRLPSDDELVAASRQLRKATLHAGDFRDCLSDIASDDFIYLDPPYPTSSRKTFGEYAYGSFSAADLPDLLDTLERIDRSGATFLMSYSQGATDAFFRKWHVEAVAVRRHIAGFAEKRNVVNEVMVTNRPRVSVRGVSS